MDALVAVRVELLDGSTCDCLTLGQSGLSMTEVEAAVRQFVNTVIEPGQAASSALCASMQEVREKQYFFEAVAEATAEQARYGWSRIGRWLLRRRLQHGRSIWFLGRS